MGRGKYQFVFCETLCERHACVGDSHNFKPGAIFDTYILYDKNKKKFMQLFQRYFYAINDNT